jgi:hypothetical protein
MNGKQVTAHQLTGGVGGGRAETKLRKIESTMKFFSHNHSDENRAK